MVQQNECEAVQQKRRDVSPQDDDPERGAKDPRDYVPLSTLSVLREFRYRLPLGYCAYNVHICGAK
jgi:hypothetical protein